MSGKKLLFIAVTGSLLLAANPLFAVTSRLLPPAYLSVPHFKKCLGTKTAGSANFWCLPAKKPRACPRSSWKALVPLFNSAVQHC